jgi:hypothetical protein
MGADQNVGAATASQVVSRAASRARLLRPSGSGILPSSQALALPPIVTMVAGMRSSGPGRRGRRKSGDLMVHVNYWRRSERSK